MFRYTIWYICLFLVCSSLISCAEPSYEIERTVCEPINTLRSVDFDGLNLETLPAWIAKHYSVSETDLLEFYSDGSVWVQWRYGGRVYAAFFEGQSLRSLWICPWSSDIRAYQVMKCFGDPDFYGAYVVSNGRQKRYDVHLWYPDEGIVAVYKFVSTTGDFRPSINRYLEVCVIVFRPDSLDKVIAQAYIPAKFFPPGWSQFLKPWPGAWEKIELTELSR